MIKNLIISDHAALWSKTNNILIGEWCANNKGNFNIKKKNYKTTNYHWDNKKKIKEDLNYLYKLYDFILNSLTLKLNKYHNINFTKRCWEIVLSKWLWFYLLFYFDRWEQINNLSNKKKLFAKLINFDADSFVSEDSQNFAKIIVSNDWNHWSYSEIIKFTKKIKYKYINKSKVKISISNNKKPNYLSFKIFVAKIFNTLSTKNFYCLNVFYGLLAQVNFSIVFREFRSRIIFYKQYKEYKLDVKIREKYLSIKKRKSTIFEKFILQNIIRNLPKSYFENFSSINEMISTLSLPESPKAIMTANEHHFNDVFKIYCASKVMNKSKYYIFQHGGSYGSADVFPTEKLDIKISDKFFSWGWQEKDSKINKFFCNKNFFKKRIIKRKKKTAGVVIPYIECLLYLNNIASGRPRNKNDVKKYVDILKDFYGNLKPKIKKDSFFKSVYKIKSDHHMYGFYVKNSLKHYHKNAKFFASDASTSRFLDKFKLSIETLNSTGYLESLQLNLPTIIIFNKSFCGIRNTAKEDFNDLKKINILFDNPINAANFINKNYNNLEEWWSNLELQKIREKFCNKYVRNSDTPFQEFKNVLKNA